MKIIIKKNIHIPVKTIKERTYVVNRITKSKLGKKIYHIIKPDIYCWNESDIEKEKK